MNSNSYPGLKVTNVSSIDFSVGYGGKSSDVLSMGMSHVFDSSADPIAGISLEIKKADGPSPGSETLNVWKNAPSVWAQSVDGNPWLYIPNGVQHVGNLEIVLIEDTDYPGVIIVGTVDIGCDVL